LQELRHGIIHALFDTLEKMNTDSWTLTQMTETMIEYLEKLRTQIC
jgi:hypothetical protein